MERRETSRSSSREGQFRTAYDRMGRMHVPSNAIWNLTKVALIEHVLPKAPADWTRTAPLLLVRFGIKYDLTSSHCSR